jgi:hypothetical protein
VGVIVERDAVLRRSGKLDQFSWIIEVEVQLSRLPGSPKSFDGGERRFRHLLSASTWLMLMDSRAINLLHGRRHVDISCISFFPQNSGAMSQLIYRSFWKPENFPLFMRKLFRITLAFLRVRCELSEALHITLLFFPNCKFLVGTCEKIFIHLRDF